MVAAPQRLSVARTLRTRGGDMSVVRFWAGLFALAVIGMTGAARADASEQAKRPLGRACTVLIFGCDLCDDALRRGNDGEFADAGIVGHVAGRVSVFIETSVALVGSPPAGRRVRRSQFPHIEHLIVVHLLAAGRQPKPVGDNMDVLPDELVSGLG